MIHVEYKDLRFKIKALNDAGEFEGYAAYKGNVDSYGDIIENGAFKRTIRNRKSFPILFMHDPAQPIGLSTFMKEDERGLFTKGKLDIEGNDIARRVYSGLKNGYIDSMSIGYKVVQDDMNKRGNRILKEIKLLEYSLITKGFAANDMALVSGFKSTHDYNHILQRIAHLEEKRQEEDEPPMEMNPDIVEANYNQQPIDIKGRLYSDTFKEWATLPPELETAPVYNFTDLVS